MAGFLALPHDVMSWFPGDPLSGLLYVYLANTANWRDSDHPLPRQGICLKSGQLVCSQRGLELATGLSRKQIRTRLENLTRSAKIRPEKGPDGTIITIINYKELFAEILERGQRWASDGPSEGQQRALSEQENKRTKNKEQEDTYVGSARADPTPYGSFLELWNQNRGQLASVQKITKGRKLKIKARLTEEPSLDYWAQTVKRMAASTFCCSGGWASFDWLTTNDTNHLKVTEGKYDNKTSNQEDMAFLERQRLRDEELERAGIRDWK